MGRKRKPARQFHRPGALTAPEHGILTDGGEGMALLGEEIPQIPDVDLRAAWERHRAELLAEFIGQWPGRRPAGFWKFDIGPAEANLPEWWRGDWWREFEFLDARGLISGDERLRFGGQHFKQPYDLGGRTPEEAAVELIQFQATARYPKSARDLNRWSEEWAFRGRWHAAHGRADLGEFYSIASQGLQALAEERETKT